jgi:hypothetical protein
MKSNKYLKDVNVSNSNKVNSTGNQCKKVTDELLILSRRTYDRTKHWATVDNKRYSMIVHYSSIW